jgi:flagellar hook-associated protein 1 FlgK
MTAISTFFGLHTALSGILAQQRALDVTAHNVANANTVGYSRQEATLVATPAFPAPSINGGGIVGQIGTGVTVEQYRRVRDAFIDVQLRAQTMKRGEHEAVADGLDQVELALAEPGETGIQSLLDRFWDAWQDVSDTPENLATRQALVQSAASLADGLRTLDGQLATIATQAGQQIGIHLDEVNSIGARILDLNTQIAKATAAGDTPNDLLDQRDVLVDRLAELGNVSIADAAAGTIDVTFAGATLVTGTTSSATLVETDLTSLSAGRLAGLVSLRDTIVPGYRASLDAIASSLVTATNTLHATGFDLSGAAGGAFFAAGGTTAATIAVDATLSSDPSLIAASSASGAPGNAGVALALAALRSSPTITVAYRELVTQIGSDTREAHRARANAQLLGQALEDRRDSVSGVSLDEEMTNLTRFQRGYQASARALSVMDEMIDQLVNRTGRVGL